jgi:hypothetical protein
MKTMMNKSETAVPFVSPSSTTLKKHDFDQLFLFLPPTESTLTSTYTPQRPATATKELDRVEAFYNSTFAYALRKAEVKRIIERERRAISPTIDDGEQ